MALVNRSRPKIGDVIEIETTRGLAYAHFTHKHDTPPKYGALIRVLPGFYEVRPSEFFEIVNQAPQFITFFPLGSSCNRKIVSIVANETISKEALEFPTFRAAVMTPNGRGPWWLWDGDKEWKVGLLKAGMEKYPIRGTINDTLLVERIIQEWRHELDT